MIYLALMCLILAGIAKAVMDTLTFHYGESIFTRFKSHNWNPVYSSGNKYIIKYKILDNKVWRYLKRTVFVWTTDAWHFFQLLWGLSSATGYVLIGMSYPLVAIAGYTLERMVFELFFSTILVRQKKT